MDTTNGTHASGETAAAVVEHPHAKTIAGLRDLITWLEKNPDAPLGQIRHGLHCSTRDEFLVAARALSDEAVSSVTTGYAHVTRRFGTIEVDFQTSAATLNGDDEQSRDKVARAALDEALGLEVVQARCSSDECWDHARTHEARGRTQPDGSFQFAGRATCYSCDAPLEVV